MKKSLNLHEQAAKKTYSQIIESAQKVFIRSGFSGASMGEIAKEASINQSLIYHYFQSKEELWRAVKSKMTEKLRNPNTSNKSDPIVTLDDLLEYLVASRFEIYLENPDLVRMLLWQTLEGDPQNISGTKETWLNNWIEKIEELKKSNEISAPLSPEEIVILINGIICAPFMFGSYFEKQVDKSSFCKKIIPLLKKTLKNTASSGKV